MHYFISGGTGFVGGHLVPALLSRGNRVTVLTRDYARARLRLGSEVELVRETDELPADTRIDVVINLAGAGIADRRWTRKRKAALVESRIQVTRGLLALVQRLEQKPSCFINGSGVGFYGASDERELTESSPGGDEFSHELCKRWEEEGRKAESLGLRTCIVRLGVVLGGDGGMLKKLLLPFRLGLGGRIGSGRQILSWIHVDDVVAALQWLAEEESAEGVYNLTAPHPVSNREFTRVLAAALRRPAILPLPAWFLRLAFGEMGDRLLLNGQCVLPARLQDAGFEFKYPELPEALRNCV